MPTGSSSWATSQGGDAAIDDLADRHEHVVGVSDRVGPRRVPGVYVDNERGTLLALEHLWELGHRSIICVADERMADGPLRAAVYERFMREHGVAERARVYFTTQPDPEPSYRLGRELFAHFDRPSRPTAVFAASDTIAIGLLQAAFQARSRRPGPALDRRASTTSTSRRSRSRR